MDLTYDDLLPFAPSLTAEQADILIRGATARAASIAPCITSDSFANMEAARSVILGAVLRKLEVGSGGVVTKTVGPFSETMDSSAAARVLFWPGEIAELQRLCGSAGPAYSFPDPLPYPDPAC